MISRASINDRVREWGLREDIVEKDYVLGWLLWGIGSDPTLSAKWIFKGGTCLKKCYIESSPYSPGYLLRIKVENVELPGMVPTIGHVSLAESTIDEIAAFLIEKAK